MNKIKYSIHSITDEYGLNWEDDPVAIVTIDATGDEIEDSFKARQEGLKSAGRNPRDAGFYIAFPITNEEIRAKIDALDAKKAVWVRGLKDIQYP